MFESHLSLSPRNARPCHVKKRTVDKTFRRYVRIDFLIHLLLCHGLLVEHMCKYIVVNSMTPVTIVADLPLIWKSEH